LFDNESLSMPLHQIIEEISDQYIDYFTSIHDGENVTRPNPFYIVGKPGIGKTEMFKEYFSNIEEEKVKKPIKVIDRTPALEPLERFSGIPEIRKSNINHEKLNYELSDEEKFETIWSIPELVADAYKAIEGGFDVVIFFDDWHRCDANIQSIGFELFTHGKLSNHILPKNVAFILAGNDSTAAGAEVQLSAIINRCTIFNCYPDVHYWIENYAVNHGVHDIIKTFLGKEGNEQYFIGEEITTEQFPTPRSWTNASRQLQALERKYNNKHKTETYDRLVSNFVYGNVGRKAEHAFTEFRKMYEHFNGEKIILDGKFEKPDNILGKYILGCCSANEYYNLILRIYGKYNPKVLETIINGKEVEQLSEKNKTFYEYNYKNKTNKQLEKAYKEFSQKFDTYTRNLFKVLDYLKKSNSEIVYKLFIELCKKPKNEKYNFDGGPKLFERMLYHKIPNEEYAKTIRTNKDITNDNVE